MWNEFLPISTPITAIVVLSCRDIACSLTLAPLGQASLTGGAGARPDHPISRRCSRLNCDVLNDVSYPQYQLRQRGRPSTPCPICLITASISARSQTSANLPSSTPEIVNCGIVT